MWVQARPLVPQRLRSQVPALEPRLVSVRLMFLVLQQEEVLQVGLAATERSRRRSKGVRQEVTGMNY